MKKLLKLSPKITKHACAAIVATAILAMMAYGLVYAPMKQLEISQANLFINNQAIQIAEAKDVKKCISIADQQLASSIAAAEESGTEVSDGDKEAFKKSIYLSCLQFEARDYIVQNIQEADKQDEEEKSDIK
jgi:hypothetical protein